MIPGGGVLPPFPRMSNTHEHPSREHHPSRLQGHEAHDGRDRQAGESLYNDEVYTRRVYAGKRTYFLDVKSTRSGEDFYVTITERKRLQEGGQEKFRIFLYKEDFGEFVCALHDVIHHIKEERLPEHEFDLLPELTGVEGGDE